MSVNRRMGIFLVVCFIQVFFFPLLLNGANTKPSKIPKSQAIKIANKKANALGYDIKKLSIRINKFNTPWNKYLPKNAEDKYDTDRISKLKNREYWAVYYYPTPITGKVIKGGDFCIFVDSSTGEIITEIMWE